MSLHTIKISVVSDNPDALEALGNTAACALYSELKSQLKPPVFSLHLHSRFHYAVNTELKRVPAHKLKFRASF